jgi:glycosyltransferase involved in cell wall biosynthesis
MQNRDVTVVVPAYNGECFIRETLESISNQSCPPKEIIVVDDCSIDSTRTVVRDFGASQPYPVRLIALQRNSGGPANPMNIGIAAAESKYVAVLDHDDLYCTNHLESALMAMERHPDADLVCGNYIDIDSSGVELLGTASNDVYAYLNVMEQYDENGVMRCFGDGWLKEFFYAPGAQRSCSNHFFRKEAWDRIGGYRESASFASDYDFVLRIFGAGILWLQELQFRKRTHSSNTWRTSPDLEKQLSDLQCELTNHLGNPSMVQWNRDALKDRIRRMRWKSEYRISRELSLRLIRSGDPLSGCIEFSKSLLGDYFRLSR